MSTGELALDDEGVLLEGATRHGELRRRRLPYAELADVHVGRAADERLGGRPALRLRSVDGGLVQVAAMGAGMLLEIADLLATRTSTAPGAFARVALIVPLRKECGDLARGLIAEGPPFDPQTAGLERHHVLLSDREAIFVFEGTAPREALEQLAGNPDLWRAAIAWRGCIAGKPRVAEGLYSWANALDDAAVGATALHGESR